MIHLRNGNCEEDGIYFSSRKRVKSEKRGIRNKAKCTRSNWEKALSGTEWLAFSWVYPPDLSNESFKESAGLIFPSRKQYCSLV